MIGFVQETAGRIGVPLIGRPLRARTLEIRKNFITGEALEPWKVRAPLAVQLTG